MASASVYPIEQCETHKNDPRYGWRDHCWQDAVALLGSEDAVQKYIEDKHEKVEESAAQHDGPTDLLVSRCP